MNPYDNEYSFGQNEQPADTGASQPVPPQQEAPHEVPQQTHQPFCQEAAYQSVHQEPRINDYSAYRGAGSGRKESPYANSPYVMNHPPHYAEDTWAHRYQPQNDYVPPVAPKVKKTRKKSGFWKKAMAAVLVLAVTAGGCGVTALLVNHRWEDRTAKMEQSFTQQIQQLQQQIRDTKNTQSAFIGSGTASGDYLSPSQVYATNVNSVVAISSTIQSSSLYGVSEGTSTGSGFILSEDGYVVTNCHVVEGATAVSVIVHNGTEYPAKVLGTDSTNDIAVLKIDATDLPAASVGSSDALIIGDMVVAIGNPLGELTSTQTVGYVSGKDRDVTTDGSIISMIQTDAAINSGNSGGPRFNMYGEVVGITTAKYSGTTGSGASIEGIGFAIPIDDVKGIISDLIEYGYVTGAYMGVTVQNTDEESAAMFGLPVGAYILSVEKGGAAERAGIQPKDIIIDLGGHKVTGITTLTRALRNFKAGDTTTVTLVRGGSQLTLDITLDEKPHAQETAVPERDGSMPSEGNPDEWYDYFRDFFDD